ncbi:MAG: AAA family ATPase [Acidobacteria bacterium]|nr:MAG: AAA family ATPase [Acidobacteriota bacterium]
MNNGTAWQKGNTRYLSAALAWLRACMEQLAEQQPEDHGVIALPMAPARQEQQKSIWRQWRGRSAELPARTANLRLTIGSRGNERVRQAATELQAAAEMGPPPALLILAQRLGLSQFEQQLLILCLGMELDSGIADLCARCQKNPARPYPTFALAFSLLDEASWDALSPERPLRYWRLIEITQAGSQALTSSALRADERIVNYSKGLNYLDDRLLPLLTPIELPITADLPASHRQVVDTIVRRLKLTEANRSLPVMQLLGSDVPSKQLIASEVAVSIGLQIYRLPAMLLPTQAADIETLARLWQRESLLLPLALYVDSLASGAETSAPGQSSPVTRLLERLEGAVFLDTRDSWPGLHKANFSIDVAKPTSAEQSAAWAAALGLAAGESPGQLAAQFNLGFTAIRQLARDALSFQGDDQSGLHERLWEACLASTRPQLDILAERIEPKATWNDIVLPTAESALLHQIAEQVAHRTTVYEKWGFGQKMSRGLGISALFSGESGTGKTMAAEVIAHELRMNLYRIDLSAVISKYIGETEKNLRRLFDAAESGGAILFFDEADALFGKRSEVSDSHDRYANIEINYLLQRMEAYRGLAILATNMKSALDPAFLRRLRFIVRFPFSGVAERKAIWQKVFPADIPKVGLDYDRLARLNITGGHIHNITINAAFLAARTNSPVSMPLVLTAARAEFRKIERPINEADFRWQEPGEAVA